MPNSAIAIAHAFVKKGIAECMPVTQMKLQKLVFFAHGLHMSISSNSSPLINESFQAWKFGPVVPEIYHTYKYYGDEKISDMFWLFGEEISLDEYVESFDQLTKKTIDTTWLYLKGISAIKLSNWTHKEGSPWEVTYKKHERSLEIPNALIKEYFSKNIVKLAHGEANEDEGDQRPY